MRHTASRKEKDASLEQVGMLQVGQCSLEVPAKTYQYSGKLENGNLNQIDNQNGQPISGQDRLTPYTDTTDDPVFLSIILSSTGL